MAEKPVLWRLGPVLESMASWWREERRRGGSPFLQNLPKGNSGPRPSSRLPLPTGRPQSWGPGPCRRAREGNHPGHGTQGVRETHVLSGRSANQPLDLQWLCGGRAGNAAQEGPAERAEGWRGQWEERGLGGERGHASFRVPVEDLWLEWPKERKGGNTLGWFVGSRGWHTVGSCRHCGYLPRRPGAPELLVSYTSTESSSHPCRASRLKLWNRSSMPCPAGTEMRQVQS